MLLKIHIHLILFLSFSTTAFSQSVQRHVFCTSGSYANSGSVILESNIGEFFIETYSGPSNILTQGFIQPDLSIITYIGNNDSNYEGSVYPNPVKNILYLDLGEQKYNNLMVEIVDVLGRKKVSQQVSNLYRADRCEINFESLPSGVYFVRVYSLDNNWIKILKVSKI